jgi:DNA-binding NarL/FixJ family response regulator
MSDDPNGVPEGGVGGGPEGGVGGDPGGSTRGGVDGGMSSGAQGRPDGDPHRGGEIEVLVVDDQELFRAGVVVILNAQEGIRVLGEAGDGRDAVRLVDDLDPDVVLMDLRMPGMDGVEATRLIYATPRARPVRVLVLTTFNLDDRAAAAIRHGASGFLLKDTTPGQLADAVRSVYAGNAVLAPTDLTALLETQFAAQAPVPDAYLSLSEKERMVFRAVARGLSNAEIAAEIFASESTVKTHVGAILRKLSLRDRVQIVVFAHEHGLLG